MYVINKHSYLLPHEKITFVYFLDTKYQLNIVNTTEYCSVHQQSVYYSSILYHDMVEYTTVYKLHTNTYYSIFQFCNKL